MVLILDVLRPGNREGSYQGETKRSPTTSGILINYLLYIQALRIGELWGKWSKLNDPGRKKIGRQAQYAKLYSDLRTTG